MSDPKEHVELSRKALEDLCQRANYGDQLARASLITWMDENPEVWRQVGDVGARTELILRSTLSQGDAFQEECLRREAESIRRSLLSTEATPLESMVAQEVVVCWLGLHLALQRRVAVQSSAGSRSERAVASAQRLFSTAVNDFLSLQKVLGRPDCAAAIGSVFRAFDTDRKSDSDSRPDILGFDRDAVAKPVG